VRGVFFYSSIGSSVSETGSSAGNSGVGILTGVVVCFD